MKKVINSISFAIVTLLIVAVGCGEQGDSEADMENNQMANDNTAMTDTQNNNMGQNDMSERSNMAVAVLSPTEGNKAAGTVTFEKVSDGVQVHAELSGLPEGDHGFHIHLYGDCRANDGTSAGTHFNFEGSSKNPPSDIDRITGNLGTLSAGQNGQATADTLIENATLTGAKSILGRAVIVHAKGNDPSQPPIGAAGARLGCGVIGSGNPEFSGGM